MIRTHLPASLRRLTIFKDSDTVFRPTPSLPRFQFRHLGITLADHSINLQKLSLACLIDARDFFAKFSHRQGDSPVGLPYWPNLTELALTASSLRRAGGDMMALFGAAARAAKRMPELETLKMWYSSRWSWSSVGSVFRYERSRQSSDGRHATSVLTILNSWNPAIDPPRSIVEQWRCVAHKHSGLDLVVETGGWPPESEGSGTMLQHLKLRHLILHPISLPQIRSEVDSLRGHTVVLPD